MQERQFLFKDIFQIFLFKTCSQYVKRTKTLQKYRRTKMPALTIRHIIFLFLLSGWI